MHSQSRHSSRAALAQCLAQPPGPSNQMNPSPLSLRVSDLRVPAVLAMLLLAGAGLLMIPGRRAEDSTRIPGPASSLLPPTVGRNGSDHAPSFATTVPAVAAILREVAGTRARVVGLLPAGASEHAYDPRPSDVRAAASSLALFHVARQLDGWVSEVGGRERIELLRMIPESELLFGADCGQDHSHDHDHGHDHGHEHDHGNGHDQESSHARTNDQSSKNDPWGHADPHFWTDPATVRLLLEPLADEMGRLDPEGAETYQANARAFDERLARLDSELRAELAEARGAGAALLHPSMAYLFRSCGLEVVGVVEPIAGVEPSARETAGLISSLRAGGARAVFTEPQLSRRSAESIATAAGLPVGELDPLGGVEGRIAYEDFVRFNVRQLREAILAR